MATQNDPNPCLPGSWLDLDEPDEPRQQSDNEIQANTGNGAKKKGKGQKKSNITKPPKNYVDAESAYHAPRYFLQS